MQSVAAVAAVFGSSLIQAPCGALAMVTEQAIDATQSSAGVSISALVSVPRSVICINLREG